MSNIINFFKRLRIRFLKLQQAHRILLYALLAGGILLIGMGLFLWLRPVKEKQFQLTIASSSPQETRNTILTYLARKAPELGVSLNIQPCDGTIKALEMIDSGKLDLALVQGIVRMPKDSNVRQAAEFYSEPLHLLVKAEIESKVRADLKSLAGRRINVSARRTATNLLATFVLDFIGLKPGAEGKPNGYTPLHMSNKQILQTVNEIKNSDSPKREGLREKLPDAFIIVNTLPSKLAATLVRNAQYRLIPLRFGKAIAMISVEEAEVDEVSIDQLHLEIDHIPAFTYSVSPPVPAEPLETLGIPMILVANKNVPDEAVTRLLSLIYDGPVRNIYHPPSLSEISPEYPLHPGTIQFRDRHKPLLRSDVINWISQFLSVGGLLFGGLLALYGYFRWRRLLRFRMFFHRLLHLERVAIGESSDSDIPDDAQQRNDVVQSKLDELQRQALVDFCNNYLVGEGVLGNLLMSIGQARHRLTSPTSSNESDKDDQDPSENEIVAG